MNPWYGQHYPYYPQPGQPGFAPGEFPLESPPYMGQPFPFQPPQHQQPFAPDLPHQPPVPLPPPLPGRPPDWEERRPLFQGLQGLFKRRNRRSFLLAHQMANALGQPVQVATYAGEVKGEVAGVYPDHLLLRQEEKKYHVRWEGIVYISPSEEK
ncbi:DUF2642 domain-containing protein [Desmospora profundinema]|uniref:DUF2642 domain-containing protein n=1 Tax=Desmospora profundinema TaxID=1571184 RepID=A0ABU1IKS6_9BACL|nr:DUF2642 domain-containing protein [Desmospora profundinema]MDR6225291.1 hypothetical protein [Desmospora profundinema]